MSYYIDLMKEARKKQLKLTLKEELEILKIYESAAINISKRISTTKNTLTKAMVKDIQDELLEEIINIRNQLNKKITSSMVSAAKLPMEANVDWLNEVAKRIDLNRKWNFRKAFAQIPSQVVELLVSNKYYKDKISLDNRLWNLIDKNINEINRIINQAIIEKATPQELAKYLEQYVNPEKVLKTRNRVLGINKNITYQAQRLARTSMAHAFNESTIQSSEAIAPFTNGWKWNLSKNHYERMKRFNKSASDICDQEYAAHDEGLGKGVYSNKNDIPVDHPNGLCYITTEVMSIKEAGDKLRNWRNGSGDYELDMWYKKWEEDLLTS